MERSDENTITDFILREDTLLSVRSGTLEIDIPTRTKTIDLFNKINDTTQQIGIRKTNLGREIAEYIFKTLLHYYLNKGVDFTNSPTLQVLTFHCRRINRRGMVGSQLFAKEIIQDFISVEEIKYKQRWSNIESTQGRVAPGSLPEPSPHSIVSGTDDVAVKSFLQNFLCIELFISYIDNEISNFKEGKFTFYTTQYINSYIRIKANDLNNHRTNFSFLNDTDEKIIIRNETDNENIQKYLPRYFGNIISQINNYIYTKAPVQEAERAAKIQRLRDMLNLEAEEAITYLKQYNWDLNLTAQRVAARPSVARTTPLQEAERAAKIQILRDMLNIEEEKAIEYLKKYNWDLNRTANYATMSGGATPQDQDQEQVQKAQDFFDTSNKEGLINGVHVLGAGWDNKFQNGEELTLPKSLSLHLFSNSSDSVAGAAADDYIQADMGESTLKFLLTAIKSNLLDSKDTNRNADGQLTFGFNESMQKVLRSTDIIESLKQNELGAGILYSVAIKFEEIYRFVYLSGPFSIPICFNPSFDEEYQDVMTDFFRDFPVTNIESIKTKINKLSRPSSCKSIDIHPDLARINWRGTSKSHKICYTGVPTSDTDKIKLYDFLKQFLEGPEYNDEWKKATGLRTHGATICQYLDKIQARLIITRDWLEETQKANSAIKIGVNYCDKMISSDISVCEVCSDIKTELTKPYLDGKAVFEYNLEGGSSIYNYIINPETNIKVNINSKLGNKILNKYLISLYN